jgi:hypothetical protein
VRRIYRRVCELRATGRTDEATALENAELTAAVAEARVSGDPAVDESALLAGEDERVADARLLAELIAPLLATRLNTLAPRPSSSAEPFAPAREAVPTRPASSTLQIADMIDDMLTQAAAPPRPRS